MAVLCLGCFMLALAVLIKSTSGQCDENKCLQKYIAHGSLAVRCRTGMEAIDCGRSLLSNPACSEDKKEQIRIRLEEGENVLARDCGQETTDCDIEPCMQTSDETDDLKENCRFAGQVIRCIQTKILNTSRCSDSQKKQAQRVADRLHKHVVSECGSERTCDIALCLGAINKTENRSDACSVGNAMLSCIKKELKTHPGCIMEQQNFTPSESEVKQFLNDKGCKVVEEDPASRAGRLRAMVHTLELAMVATIMTYIY